MKTALPDDTREFLGIADVAGRDSFASEDPSFSLQKKDLDAYDERTRNERAAMFRAAGEELFRTDLSKLDDAGAWGLYHAVTESMFELSDEDGTVAFGRRASKDPRQNIELLRRFLKGEWSLIEDPEYSKWREMSAEEKFRYALENEKTSNALKSYMKGERGAGFWENVAGGAGMSMVGLPAGATAFQPDVVKRQNEEIAMESARRSNYETLTDEEKERYRADVVADYDEKLSRRQTLATFLSFSQGLSDRASYLLAKSFNDGELDPQVLLMDNNEEQRRVLSAFSMMRGDQKRGTLLFVPTDFTDDTVLNRVQLGLYGLQQSVLGLATDTWDMTKDAAMWTYAKAALSESERADFFKWWDAQARAEQAMKQQLPEADTFAGEAYQSVMENLHWFIPYSEIGKGGKMVTAARGLKESDVALKGWKKVFQPLKDLQVTLKPMRLGGSLKEQKAAYEAGKAAMEAKAAATKAAWALDVNGVKKLGEMGSSILARQMAAVERYTQLLHGIDNDLKAAKWWKDAAGTGMWLAGEASAFSAFASEYVANADAAGISREESVPTAAIIGLINAKVEQLYVPGLESSLSPAQLKSLTFAAMAQAVRSDGAAGFRKWLANRIGYGVIEGLKVAVTEGLVEEPLQQMAIEHGKAFDKLCQELRKNGQATLADRAEAFWTSFAETLPQDYATFIDTAADMLPSSVGFGATTIGNMTRNQHIHNVLTRHANRRAGSTSTMGTAQTMEELLGATDYDAGVVDVIQRAVDVRNATEKYWEGNGGEEQKNPHRFEEAITAARKAFRDPQTRDVVGEVAKAAGVDVKTAEVLTQYLQVETEAAAFSPTVRAFTALNMSLADIDEQTIKTVLPGYIEGSFASDPEKGVYSGMVKLADGTERTIAYKVGDISGELMARAEAMAKPDSAYGKSFDARHAEIGDGVTWASLSDRERYMFAVNSQASVNGFSSGTSGVFELTNAKGEKVQVNANDIIYLASGRIADIGYGPAATMGTARHETFHSLWRFVRATLDEADVQALAKTLGVDVTKDGWEVELDEKMAHEMERYASGHHVSHAVSSRFDKMVDGWAGKLVNFFAQFGQRDEVTDPKTGKPYQLKDLYDRILRGELGSGALGVELAKIPAQPAQAPAKEGATKSAMPVEVTDEERKAQEDEMRAEAAETQKAETGTPVAATTSAPVATSKDPADASTPNQRFYRVGLPNSNVKLVGRLEVRDAERGLVTSTDEGYHDRGNQNRDDRSEESRALVERIGANPDPLQVGTVQPIANNGIVWALPNGDVIIGNHRVNGVRIGYEKGTAAELEKFVREDAAKRGIEIGEDVTKPLLVFVLERIESPDGTLDNAGFNEQVHEVVRLANESQNRGFNIREQAVNDAKILIDNNLLPRMAFRPDGRIDETKSGDAIGKFRQETGAQGMIAEDGSLTEEGQTRIQNAALAALLGGEGAGSLLQKIMANAGRLDMQNELRALMKMTPGLMSLAEAKPAYDLRGPLAEALQLFTEWREKYETARLEKGKTRHDWRETAKDGRRVRGISWEQFMSQGDMFRKPSDEAKILGDLFARAEAERSFDREDVESAVGKKRAIDLITGYLEDYIENAKAANTETDDMFGAPPPSRAEVMAAQRAKGEGGPRFSVNPHLKEDVSAALNTDPAKGKVEKGGKRVVFGRSQRLFPALGLPEGDIYSKVYALRKIAAEHNLTAEQIASAPDLMEEPAAVFDDEGKGYIFLTDAIAPDEDGVDAPVMFYIRPDGEGNYIASAYARKETSEAKYVHLANAGKVLYWDKSKIARLPLRGEAQSSLITFSAGDNVVTPEGVDERIIAHSAGGNQGRYSISGIYTGSAADYDKPSVQYIGTGEGNQVYGWGLYGSNRRGVAAWYSRKVAAEKQRGKADENLYFGRDEDLYEYGSPGWVAAYFWRKAGSSEEAKRLIKDEMPGAQELYDTYGYNPSFYAPSELKEAYSFLEKNGGKFDNDAPSDIPSHLYEQTWFTNRAPGDESHLLKWYEPVSEEQRKWVEDELRKEYGEEKEKEFRREYRTFSSTNQGHEMYYALSYILSEEKDQNVRRRVGAGMKAASEFLYRAGIDGVKYPVDSYGGKTVKDGDKAGWNYVAFSDENIRVDHKWTDGEQRFSIAAPYNPRSKVPAVRGGWNEKKIIRYLKANPSPHGVWTAARFISEFDTVDELKDHMFYHGTKHFVGGLQPSIVRSEKWAAANGGGGYGERYWGVSVSKSKKIASHFGNPSPSVSIYPVVLAKGAKVIDRPDLRDARDIEDHIVELWNDGVDAVRLGDWNSGYSEQELLVLNPRAICNIGTADTYRYFRLGSPENPLDIKDDAHITRMLEAAKDYTRYSPSKQFGKPQPPSMFQDETTELKPKDVYNAEREQYEKDIAAWRESEQGIAASEYERRMRDAIRFSIAGRTGAANLGISGRSEAEKMEKAGAEREEIWRKTGWWRGRDDQWRVELPDIKIRSAEEIEATVKLNGNSILLEEIVDAPELFRAYPDLRETEIYLDPEESINGAKASYVRRGDRISLYGAGQIKVAHLNKWERDMYETARSKVNSDDFLEHWLKTCDALEIKHGTFAEERKKAKELLSEIEARTAKENSRRLKAITGDTNDLRSTLTHEIQHWIQYREEFAKGGSPESFREARELNKALAEEIATMMNAHGFASWKNSLVDAGTLLEVARAAWDRWPDSKFPIERQYADEIGGLKGRALLDKIETADEIYTENAKQAGYGYTEDEAYRSLSGEVESRNAEKRLDMTAEERAAVPPWETEDVPSNRQIIRFSVAQTSTPEFKKWFRNSKVVNRAGAPRVVYHGTPNGKFWTFDKNRIGETWNADDAGFFFTSDKSQAEEYTKPFFRESTADPYLFAVYLSIQNPLVVNRAWWQAQFGRSDIHNHDAVEIWDTEQQTILDAMREGGHDGVIIDPNPMGGAAKMYMVPEPSQIKSATDNIGTFDSTNPDIRYSIEDNINKILSRFDEAKGKTKEEIIRNFDNEQKIIGWLPDDLPLPPELDVAQRVVKGAQAYILNHLVNKPKHEKELTASDAKRMLMLINPRNEMRVVPQNGYASLAFIAPDPSGGWDCTVIAPRRGEFYIFKTMFGQSRKPYQDKPKVRFSVAGSSVRNKAVGSLIRGPLASLRDVDQTGGIVPNSDAQRNRDRSISSDLVDAMRRRKTPESAPVERLSTEAPRFKFPGPLNALSDDELISVGVAARMALSKSDKFSDRAVKINTIQDMMRRLHPDWSNTDIGRESNRIVSDARSLGKKIREDLDRGVSESLILEHLPDAAREQFGREMREEARKGQRLGVFAQRVKGEIEERQARIVEDAVRVQTGLDAENIENAYGINLSETIMHLSENPLAEKPPQGFGGAAGAGEAVAAATGGEEAEESAAEIDAKVKAVVEDMLAASQAAAEADARDRRSRRDSAGRGAERTDATAGNGAGGSASGDSSAGEGDALATAAKKEGLDLENPRHLAQFVSELARRQWIKEHDLGQNAEVWRDLVAVQFLRKTAQSVYAKLCRDLTYSRGRETAMQHIAKLDAVPTVAGLISEMEFIGALINARRIWDTQQQKCEMLDLFLREKFGAQGRFKPDKEEGKRNVSTEAELRARYMRHAMWLTPDGAAEEARQLQETLNALSVDFKEAGRDVDQSREFIETIRKLNVLREFGALRYKPLGEIDAAAQWWADFERGSSDDIVREMYDREIRTKKAAHLLAAAFADPKRKTVREGDALADKLNRYITGHMGFVALLQDCMRFAPDADAAAVKDVLGYINREIQKSGDRTESEKRRHNDAFARAVENIYGKNVNAVMKDMMAKDERFTEFMGVVGGKRVTPTKARAMQLLVSLLQEGRKVQVEDEDNPGQMKTDWVGGYHRNIVKHKRQGQAQELMRLLTPADMNMIKWLGLWYEQNRSELSDVCNSLFGIGVYAELPNYFPVKMMLEKQGLEKGEGVGWTIFPKALTPRVKNERDFDTSADIFSMWASRMEEGAQWKHHAQLGLEMRGIFGRSELQASVIANHGASVNALMQGFITDILAGHGAYDRTTAGVEYFSDQVRGWTALCALGGNVGVMLKQTTSIPAFGFEIGLVNTAKYMVNAFTPEGMAAMRRIWDSEQRQTRWQVGSSEAIRNALSQNGAGALKRMFQASMITTKVGDVVPALVVGQGIYRDCLERGMSDEDAMAETWSIIERTQQSGRMENQTSIQRRNKLGRIMFQFLSTQQQYLQYETRAIRDVIARPNSVKRWGTLGRALILNHFILSSAYFWMGQLYKACLGQEPPDDELKDWMITCLLGPYGSLMVAGFMGKATLERAIKGYSIRGGSSMLPMEQWIKTQINDGARLMEAIFDSEGDTWDEMLDAAGRWMGDVNSTVRDLRKIYRFRVKGEPQKRK